MAPVDNNSDAMEDVAVADVPQAAGVPEGPVVDNRDVEAALGPSAVTVQFRWGVETFKRTDRVQCGRFVYKARGSVDGRGGLELSYSEHGGGSWELGGSSGGCLYRILTNAATPAALIGSQEWARTSGGTCHIIVMQSAATESGGWIDPALLAFDQRW
mmetsp:Transcript_11929/g.32752  ORF Transcript_11929/g.32752 Transcript_11929/m.32752 type:complete len:158 (-) Transcript_11929:99-572(-)